MAPHASALPSLNKLEQPTSQQGRYGLKATPTGVFAHSHRPVPSILNGALCPRGHFQWGWERNLILSICPSFGKCPRIPPPCRASSPTVGGVGEMRKCHSTGKGWGRVV